MDMIGRIRRSIETFQAGDLGPTLELWTDDIIWFTAGNHPLGGRHAGKSAVLEYLGRLRNLSEGTFAPELLDVRMLDPKLAMADFRNRATVGDRHLDAASALVLDLSRGHVTRIVEVHFDAEQWDRFWTAAAERGAVAPQVGLDAGSRGLI